MDYSVASADDIDSVVPGEWGGMWFFRDPLGCDSLGVTLLELEPGGKGRAHDHAADGQVEVYLVVDGELTVELGGGADDPPEESIALESREALRVAADTWRQLHNRGDERVRVVIAGAP